MMNGRGGVVDAGDSANYPIAGGNRGFSQPWGALPKHKTMDRSL
jgi:hypothetical protein